MKIFNLLPVVLCLGFSLNAASLFAQCLSGNCDNGWGRHRDSKGRIYEGHFKNNKKEGKGTIVYSNGDRYEGGWKADLPEGFGIRFLPDGSAKGGAWEKGELVKPDNNIRRATECLSGNCKTGSGKSKDAKGRIYEGDFKKSTYEGFGTLRYSNGEYYKGMFKHGLPNGKGSYYYQDGHVDSGDWSNGRLQTAQMRVWALVVGVAEYKHITPLTYTTDDAKKVYGFFRSPEGGAVPDTRIKLLLNKDATALNIQNTMADLFEKADTNDLVIFYFAGHGQEGGFLPIDFDGKDKNILHHAVVNALMMDSPAKFKLCIADACHSGSYSLSYNDFKTSGYVMPPTVAARTLSARDKIKEFYSSFSNIKGGFAMMMSSAAEEVSLEASKLKQGVFSYFFIQGMKGSADDNENGIITVKELFDYVSQQVKSFTYGFQTPNVFGDYDTNMPVGTAARKPEMAK